MSDSICAHSNEKGIQNEVGLIRVGNVISTAFVLQLPRFFLKSHDYTMYSNDVEFINGLLNTKTR